MTPTIAVLDYGSGNVHSVARAIALAGAEPVLSREHRAVVDADAVVIPGVGQFGACMRAIVGLGLDRALRDAHEAERPLFGVCVGMQILFESSDEAPEPGLGILPGRVLRLPSGVKVPHMGWNTVEWTQHPYLEDIAGTARFYFVHSYAPAPSAETVGLTTHGRAFSAAVAQDEVFATQFHPEKSGVVGLQLYRNFVRAVAA